jgi:hypothetical protein
MSQDNVFPPNICSLVTSKLSSSSPSRNGTHILDDDWAFVSCEFSDGTRTELVVTLRASELSESTLPLDSFDTHAVIALKDLDVSFGDAMGVSVLDLVFEVLLVFTRQAAPIDVQGVIRLPYGWRPAD